MAERRKLNRTSTKTQGTLMGSVAAPLPENDFCKIYRPKTFEDVLGHEAACRSIKDVLDSRSKRSFVLVGDSGLGKTTIARIIANYVGAADTSYIEVDGAKYSGADAARELTTKMLYKPMGGRAKVICVDECHALSTQAWQCLLKSVEEPPAHGYWILCTTAAGKVPDTILTRSACYTLNAVRIDDLFGLLEVVNEEQKLGMSEDILVLVASEAGGSPRQALSSLAKCRAVKDRQEAAVLLQSAQSNPELIDLCRGLNKGGLSWDKAMKVLKGMSNVDPEGLRIQIVLYFASVVGGAKSPDQAGRAIEIMDSFLPGPYYKSNKLAELYRDLARCLLR